MNHLENYKKKWKAQQEALPVDRPFDQDSLAKLLRGKIKQQNKKVMHYFWGTFFLHILTYALLMHVAIRFWMRPDTFWLALTGIMLTIPFTAFLMKRFKQLAWAKVNRKQPDSILNHVVIQRNLLFNFYQAKNWFDYFLLPINSAIGVIIVFNLFLPGGVLFNLLSALITYLLTMVVGIIAIRSENEKRFILPLKNLQQILDEYKN